jgi:DNA-binding helix-hairpin-helix protein with protein kinase domain
LGKGGEGAVYEVAHRPDTVAKIYLQEISDERAAKLTAMQSLVTPTLNALTAWPAELLHQQDGRVAGFLMPNMRGTKDIHALYSPKTRLAEFPQADWRMLVRAALNTARAFAALHEAGCLVGDVNHGGVRVAADATVKLIDCDSFQVSANGRTFLCEVGVDNFTPPELQGKPFKTTPRTANHDNFGLAILIFQLLMMGRHPFAGRYSGSEDMPISKAISQFRYAYSNDRASSGMQPPPNTAPVSAASGTVTALWEQAFGRIGATHAGRPTAKQWISALSVIEHSFVKCSANSAHHYLSGTGKCPWCDIERIGITLFLPPIGSALPDTGSGFAIDVIWAQIAAVPSPGQAPALPTPFAAPSIAAQTIIKTLNSSRRSGWVIGIALFILATFISPKVWYLWAACGLTLGRWIAGRDDSEAVNALRDRHAKAKSAYDALTARWHRETTGVEFEHKLDVLRRLKSDWSQLPALRQRRYESLMQNRQKLALQRFLDGFDITRATVAGVGPAKKLMLESYGIETAADITLDAVQQVPGFGPALAQRLVNWRQELETRFRFDPRTGIDPRSVMDLDRDIAHRRQEIEKGLRQGLPELQQISAMVIARRKNLMAPLTETARELAQTSADLKAIHN